VALCAVLGAPGAVLAEGGSGDAASASKAGGADLRALATKVHMANMEEARLGELAVVKAASDDVADFGRDMVTDHTKADLDLLKLVREKKVAFTPGMGWRTPAVGAGSTGAGSPSAGSADRTEERGEHAATMQKLSQLSGPEFDRQYAAMMVSMHNETLRSIRDEQQRVTDSDVKSYLDDLASTVEKHQKKAQDLTEKVSKDSTGKASDMKKSTSGASSSEPTRPQK